jgi:hypothetical protein
MKKFTIILSLLFAMAGCTGNAQNKLKRYNVKSGIVEYVTTTSGKVMGSTVSGSGTEKLYFKDWGAVELKETESSQTTSMKIFGKGKAETKNSHTINKLDNGESYTVDFDKKQIYAGRDMVMDMSKNFQPNGDAGEMGESMLESMGGKKIGNEKFLGYSCDVWELLGGKQWIYKGVMLKMEMTTLGIKSLTEATSAKFDVSVADSHFKLPDFPIQKTESFLNTDEFKNEMDTDEMNEGMDKMQNLSFKEWKKMVIEGDPEMKNTSDEELRQSYDMMQKMLKLRKGK